MRPASTGVKRKNNPSKQCCLFEALEHRQALSATPAVTTDTTTSPVTALEITPAARAAFNGQVGSWAVDGGGGLPSKASGLVAIGIIDWGDGKTSRAKLVDDGSGIVQIKGQHVWANQGTFNLTIKIEEYPRAHPKQLTDIGQDSISITVAPKPHVVKIGGSFTGSYTSPFGNPDAPRRYVFTGTGSAGALGTSDLSGSISPPGFIRGSTATGELTLTNANGTLTFDVAGNLQTGAGPLPRRLTYTITGGTGTYVSAIGKGTLSLALDTNANTFLMVIR